MTLDQRALLFVTVLSMSGCDIGTMLTSLFVSSDAARPS
jgi:hypothetical protein